MLDTDDTDEESVVSCNDAASVVIVGVFNEQCNSRPVQHCLSDIGSDFWPSQLTSQ